MVTQSLSRAEYFGSLAFLHHTLGFWMFSLRTIVLVSLLLAFVGAMLGMGPAAGWRGCDSRLEPCYTRFGAGHESIRQLVQDTRVFRRCVTIRAFESVGGTHTGGCSDANRKACSV
jgi:hypothetical protein